MVQFEERVDRDRRLWLGQRLEADNTVASPVLARMAGQPAADEVPVQVYAVGDDGRVIGGVAGKTWAYWLHVDLLWVHKEHRGAGVGGRLLARAEEIARTEHGCSRVRLETWDFQAPEFYRKKGYAVVGEVADYPPGVTEYILAKKLG